MAAIVSIVGRSNAGKTELLQKLIPALKGRGYTIAAIKHAPHGFQLDIPGKDSWRLLEAGSDTVIVSSTEGVARFNKPARDMELEELAQDLGARFDIVLGEGFKATNVPKIEVHRKGDGDGLLCKPEELMAIVTDEPLDVPVWQCSREDVPKLTELIVERLVQRQSREEVSLVVNGSRVPLGSFAQGIIAGALVGMVSTLRDVPGVKSLEISVRVNKPE